MKGFIFGRFAFGGVIIAIIAVVMWLYHGWLGLVAYLLFAGLCLTPAILKARSILRRKKGGSQ